MNTLLLLWRGIRDTGLAATRDSVAYQLRQQLHRWRFARPSNPRPAPLSLGRVVQVESCAQTVTVTGSTAAYVITALAPDLVRVQLVPPSGCRYRAADSYAIAKPDDTWPPCDVAVVETETDVEVCTARIVCRISRTTGQVTFLDREGRVVSADAGSASIQPGGPVICHKRIQPDEHFYGLGERTVGLDRRGQRYETWQTDPQIYEMGQDPIHLCMPVLLGLHDQGRQGYGLLFDNTFRGHFDLGAADPVVASFGAEGGELCYYFIYGPALTTVVERYTELTGRMNLPPLWMLGYHQSRWSYYPEARVRQLADDFRTVHRVPCDAIHLDIHYMDGERCFTWDPVHFPDPAGLIADLHAQGFKVIVIIDPGIKADPGYPVCQSGLEQDVFCKLADGKTLLKGPVWPGDCYFPDFTAHRVREWWGELYRSLTDLGVDGFWNDMNEPVIFGPQGTTFPDFTRHDLEGRGGDHVEAHNVYGMQMVRATVEGLTRLRPAERPVCITRSGWAGVQRYAMSWTGDNRSDWGQLWLTMPMVMSLGLCGLANTGPDIGGFGGFASGELFTRWVQMGTFLPFMRAHTEIHSPDQEPWSWGEPYRSINRRFIELRYRLLPYLYSTFWQCAQTGLPMVRPLLLDFQDDAATHPLDDQLLCGDALLVAPVIEEGATRRTVYLPSGAWYDFWTDELYAGPAHIQAAAPLERLPLFVRAGSVVPMAPPVQYVGERPPERLILHIYPGDGQSVLYEDDGQTWAFQDGDYQLTHFTLTAKGDPPSHLEIRRQVEGEDASACQHFEVIVHGVDRRPDAIVLDGEQVQQWTWDGQGNVIQGTAEGFENLTIKWARPEE